MIVILTEIEDSVPYIKDKLKESRWATKRTLIQYRLDKDVLIHQIGDIVIQMIGITVFLIMANQL